jgi:hypothetical protein
MKKTGKKLAFSAALLAATLNIGACTKYNPAENEEPEVYGPPNDISVSVSSEDKLESDSKDTKTYSPDENMEVSVYGPPESD